MVNSLKFKFNKKAYGELNNFKKKGSQTLHNAYQEMSGDPPSKIPFLVWLLENPNSPLPFSGKIDLCRHDYLHLLLGKSFSLYDEAFIIGFTIGNDPHTKWFHIALFKLISTRFYPQKFRFIQKHFIAFDLGFWYGSQVKIKNINKLDFQIYKNKSITEVRQELGIDIYAIQIMSQTENLLTLD